MNTENTTLIRTAFEILKARYSWPTDPPPVQPNPMGMLRPDTARALAARLTPNTDLVVECGSWMGKSARMILKHAPRASIICVDTFTGHRVHLRPGWAKLLPVLLDTFIRNMWDWRSRCLYIRKDTLVGLAEVFDLGLVPDGVYLDSAHATPRVTAELAMCREFWPGAWIVGDDFDFARVRIAAKHHATLFHRKLHNHGRAFSFDPCDARSIAIAMEIPGGQPWQHAHFLERTSR